MKKITLLLASSLLLSTLVASNAGAGEPVREPARLNPAVINPNIIGIFVNWTWVKGNIKVPTNVLVGPLAGLTCADINVSATSQETNPPPPGGLFSSPKWVHHVHAAGNWASGTCTYAMTVPPNSSFAVSLGGTAPNTTTLKCYYIPIGATPGQAGWFKVPVGGTKEQDFTVNFVQCASPPG